MENEKKTQILKNAVEYHIKHLIENMDALNEADPKAAEEFRAMLEFTFSKNAADAFIEKFFPKKKPDGVKIIMDKDGIKDVSKFTAEDLLKDIANLTITSEDLDDLLQTEHNIDNNIGDESLAERYFHVTPEDLKRDRFLRILYQNEKHPTLEAVRCPVAPHCTRFGKESCELFGLEEVK